MDEQRILSLAGFQESDQRFDVIGGGWSEPFRRLDYIVECELQVIGIRDAGKAAMRRFRSEEAHHMADLVLVDQ